MLGIDIDIRSHNREAIEAHPLAKRISLIQGSSVAPAVSAQVRAKAAAGKRVLDSVSAGAVVVRDVPQGHVVVGCPAKTIRAADV